LRNIGEHNLDIDEATISHVITDSLSNRNVILAAVRLACERVKQRQLPIEILVLEPILEHPYFKIRLDAIATLIDLDWADEK
jgi:hypothetical protein